VNVNSMYYVRDWDCWCVCCHRCQWCIHNCSTSRYVLLFQIPDAAKRELKWCWKRR